METPRTDETATAEHLLQEARNASQRGAVDEALRLYGASIAVRHFNPVAHYLLGAEYAELGRTGDAIVHMTKAVEQAPELGAARLQLGLLWLLAGSPQAATAQLGPLRELPADDALRRFGEAIVLLAQSDLDGASRRLRDGLALKCDNAALVDDMARLLQRLQQTGAALPPAISGRTAAPVAPSHDMAISAYTGRSEGSG
jgi:tetratricopeptide (TPR) repeat protein